MDILAAALPALARSSSARAIGDFPIRDNTENPIQNSERLEITRIATAHFTIILLTTCV